jgi:hypothetical protein
VLTVLCRRADPSWQRADPLVGPASSPHHRPDPARPPAEPGRHPARRGWASAPLPRCRSRAAAGRDGAAASPGQPRRSPRRGGGLRRSAARQAARRPPSTPAPTASGLMTGWMIPAAMVISATVPLLVLRRRGHVAGPAVLALVFAGHLGEPDAPAAGGGGLSGAEPPQRRPGSQGAGAGYGGPRRRHGGPCRILGRRDPAIAALAWTAASDHSRNGVQVVPVEKPPALLPVRSSSCPDG